MLTTHMYINISGSNLLSATLNLSDSAIDDWLLHNPLASAPRQIRVSDFQIFTDGSINEEHHCHQLSHIVSHAMRQQQLKHRI